MLSYEEFISSVFAKATEYHFCYFTDDENNTTAINLLRGACVGFYTCRYDLSDRDDENQTFNFEVEDNREKNYIIDVLSDGMIVYWLMPYVYKSENYENLLTPTEFSEHSPSQFLRQIRTTFKETKDEFSRRVNEYSYEFADLTQLNM